MLVWALVHPSSDPALDWWNREVPAHTPGNRALRDQGVRLQKWLSKALGIKARPLPYHVENGGVFLKDAAVLAGLGTIGRHNLLITPEFGTRVRLRAMFLDTDLRPTGPLAEFDPCAGCGTPCHRACPVDAFVDGVYTRKRCGLEMERAEAAPEIVDGTVMGIDEAAATVKYCRRCELACPVAASKGR